MFDKSLELNETKLQCQFANVELIETAKYISTKILYAHFDEPTGNEGVTSVLIHTTDEDDGIAKCFPYLFQQPSLTLVLDDFKDLTMNLKYVLHTCNWFDTGQHASNEFVSTLLTTKRRKGCHLYTVHRKGARDSGLPICSYVDKWFDTGQVLWACFDMGELCMSSLLRQVQLIGYSHGFQVLDIAVASSRCKPGSWRADPVNSLQIQHFSVKCNGCKGFRPSRLLLLLLANDEMVDSTPAHSERYDFIDPGANFFIVTIRANADLYVWDLGISSTFLPLTGCIENVAALILLGCTANSSGELLLAKGDTTLLRNIICQSTQVAILGDWMIDSGFGNVRVEIGTLSLIWP
nr:uncharacterized protein LOC117274740 [Nicotiana tomentosiformis]